MLRDLLGGQVLNILRRLLVGCSHRFDSLLHRAVAFAIATHRHHLPPVMLGAAYAG